MENNFFEPTFYFLLYQNFMVVGTFRALVSHVSCVAIKNERQYTKKKDDRKDT